MIGSPVDSANGSACYGAVKGKSNDDGCGDDNPSSPIDSRNVSGSDDGASYFDGEGLGDNEDDDSDDHDDGSDFCTRDEELSVPGDDDRSSRIDRDSCSLTPSSDESWSDARPVVPPLDLR